MQYAMFILKLKKTPKPIFSSSCYKTTYYPYEERRYFKTVKSGFISIFPFLFLRGLEKKRDNHTIPY